MGNRSVNSISMFAPLSVGDTVEMSNGARYSIGQNMRGWTFQGSHSTPIQCGNDMNELISRLVRVDGSAIDGPSAGQCNDILGKPNHYK